MQRDERDIHTEKFNGFAQLVGGDAADVGAFHVHDPLVGAQFPGQLAVADIDGIDLDRTILEHAVGEAAGGRTDVHADLAVGGQREALHCFFQLQTTAADITDVVAAHLDFGVFLDHLTGLVHLLLVDEDDAGHDHGFGTFTALDQAMLNQILIQSDFQDAVSPFLCSRTACARWAASRPVASLICGTVAWGRRTFSTARWM
jgi:hypothetical protein